MNVKYWQTAKGNEGPLVSYVCFSAISFDSVDSTRYFCPINTSCDKIALDFYIGFVLTILESDRITFQFDSYGDQSGIMWYLNCKDLTRSTRLLCLTAMRYPDEYWQVVNEFFRLSKDCASDEEAFAALYEAHETCYNRGDYWSDLHALMHPGLGSVSLKVFRERVKKQKIDGVHKTFYP